MRREIEIWLNQSLRDFENAKQNFEFKEYYLSCFLVQQSIEKALKAYYIKIKNNFPDKTHSLIYLGKQLNIDSKHLTYLRKINPDFIFTRYPDIDGVAPYEAYDEEIAKERISMGEEILKWITKKIK